MRSGFPNPVQPRGGLMRAAGWMVVSALLSCAPAVENVAACYQCGARTVVQEGICVGGAEARPACSFGAGTREVNGSCSVDLTACAGASSLVNGRCEVTAAACGGGLVFSGGRCQLPAPSPM